MIISQACLLLKHLRMSTSYYAVANGHKRGIYYTWDECKAQVHKFPNAKYKKFKTMTEAQNYVKQNADDKQSKQTKQDEKPSTNKTSNVSMKKRLLPIDSVVKGKLTSKRIKLIDINEQSTPESSSKFITDDNGYVSVYTDGACKANGTQNARAGIGIWFGKDHPLNVSAPVVGRATNNMAEIQAVTIAAKKSKDAGIKKLKIITDSKFLIKCITEWMPKWKRNGWKTSDGAPVINKTELLEMEESLKSLDVIWEHVNGHVGILGNEMADKLAREGCMEYKT